MRKWSEEQRQKFLKTVAQKKARVKHKRKYTKKGRKENEISSQEEKHIAYAIGHCETWLQIYADSVRIPRTSFTSRVARALLVQTHREGLGTLD